MKKYRNRHWYFDIVRDRWILTKAGEYDIGTENEIELEIDAGLVEMLVIEFDKQSMEKPKLEKSAEDLKITHRVLDILETITKKIPS